MVFYGKGLIRVGHNTPVQPSLQLNNTRKHKEISTISDLKDVRSQREVPLKGHKIDS